MFGYSPLKSIPETPSEEGDCEALIPEQEKASASFQEPAPKGRSQLLQIIFLVFAFPLTAFLGAYFGGDMFPRSENCVAKISKYCELPNFPPRKHG